jgi:ankyrin repeat protein
VARPRLIGVRQCVAWVLLWIDAWRIGWRLGGVFVGSAYISQKRSAWRMEVAPAKREVETHENDIKTDYLRLPFSDTEEESGNADEGTEPMIHLHARLDNLEGVKRELAKGVSIELENNDSWKSRPLHRAAAAGAIQVTEYLLSLGADVRAKNGLHGWMPIHYAAKNGAAKCIQVLLQAGSPVDVRDNYDQEPILRAAESGDTAAINVLLDAGAKIDARAERDGLQPIHAASWAGHFEAVEALLARGADPNAENNHGARPLYFANLDKDSRHQKTAAILERSGARLKPHSPAG